MTDSVTLTVPQAALLGLIHGPAELLPVSSSAHTQLVPVLLGWDYPDLPDASRKTFEVALHAGTLVGLLRVTPLLGLRATVLTTVPAAIAGLLFEQQIEQRLGKPRHTAYGLIAGAALLVVGDRLTSDRRGPSSEPLRPGPAVVVGLAQIAALIPGLSRLGVTASAARAMGVPRREAFTVARSAGIPVIVGAVALKGTRIKRDGIPSELRAPMAAGLVAAAISSVIAAPLARRTPVTGTVLWRLGLATAVLRRRDLRQNGRG